MSLNLNNERMSLFRDGAEQKYTPVNLYLGDKKLAGWEESSPTAGETLSIENTYNDSASLTINGKTNQESDYYETLGETTQVVTTQGKNLFDKNKAIFDGFRIDESNGGLIASTDRGRSDYIRVVANTTYTKLLANFSSGAMYDINKVFVGTIGYAVNTFTTLSNCAYVRLSVFTANVNTAQLELGTVATSYTPFVPNSPSSQYPSSLTNNVPANTYKITANDGIYEGVIDEDLKSAETIKDRLVHDKVSKNAWIERKIEQISFDGTEEWSAAGEEQNTENTTLFYKDITSNSDDIICSHYPKIDIHEEPEEASAAGEILSLENTFNDSVNLTIDGKSTQIGTIQGVNLFDQSKHNLIRDYNTAVTNVPVNLSPNTYRFSYNIVSMQNITYSSAGALLLLRVTYQDDTTDFVQIATDSSGLERISTGFITTQRIKSLAFYSAARWTGGTITLSECQLEQGSTATPYAPFVPDSPSPDYPSAISSVSNFDLVSCGKNLFDGQLNGGTVKVEDGTIISNANRMVTGFLRVRPGTTFIRSNFAPYAASWIGYYDKNRTYLGYNANSIVSVFTTPSNCCYCIMTFSKLTTITQVDLDTLSATLQLELGTTATPYTPFRGRSTANFPYTLRSLPDGTKDYIEIDNVNKTAKLYKNVGEFVATGNENWYIPSPNLIEGIYRYAVDGVGVSSVSQMLCTHMLQGYIRIATNASTIGLLAQLNRINVYVDNCSTTEDFKSWLAAQYAAGTPVTLIYKLATPTVTDLDYEAVLTYYPQTTIYTTSEIQPILTADYKIVDGITNDVEGVQIKNNKLYIRHNGVLDINEFKSFLSSAASAAAPVKININSKNTKESLILNKVSSSSETELPSVFYTNTTSPDYPSTISSVSNFDLVSSGKNLFDKSKITNGYYLDLVTGNLIASAQYYVSDFIPVIVGKPFYFPYRQTTRTKFFNSAKAAITAVRDVSSEAQSVVIPSGVGYVRMSFYETIDPNTVQFTQSNIELPYAPFRGMQTINFPYTLRSLPDGTKDYIEIDNVAKTAKLYRNVGERVFAGTENWTKNTKRLQVAVSGWARAANNHVDINVRCTHLIGATNVAVWQGTINYSCCALSDADYFGVHFLDDTTVTDFKAWLAAQYSAGTPVKVLYKLATPVITDLDYEAVLTYYPQTQIYTTSGVQTTLEGTFKVMEGVTE